MTQYEPAAAKSGLASCKVDCKASDVVPQLTTLQVRDYDGNLRARKGAAGGPVLVCETSDCKTSDVVSPLVHLQARDYGQQQPPRQPEQPSRCCS